MAGSSPAEGPARPALAPSLAIVASTLLWGTMWIPLRELDRAGLAGAWATTAGFLLPLLALLPFGVANRRRLLAGGHSLLAGGLLMAVSIALYAEALLRGQVARVILLFYLTPVWSTLLARAMLGVPISGRRLVTIALGLAGLVVTLGDAATLPVPRSLADAMGLLSGFCWGWGLVHLQRARHAPDLDKVFVQLLFLGPAFFLLASIPGGRSWAAPSDGALLAAAPWLAAFGLVWMPGLLWLTMFGGSRIDPGRVAVLLMLEIVVGIGSAAWLTDEPFGAREALGAALIVSACGSELLAEASSGARRRSASR